jgi:hypothetical protein
MILVILAGFLALFVLFSTGPLRGYSVAQTPTSRFEIQFLNPSGYPQADEEEVSSKDDGTDQTYHLVAWVNELPGTTRVEFHYRDPSGGGQVLIGVATQTPTPDTFEFNWDPPDNLADGPLTLYALLFDGDTEVARDTESDLTLNDKDNNPQSPNPNETEQRGDTVEITYPLNGDKFGIYKPRDATSAATVINVTSDSEVVAVFYSISAPGDEPLWTQCGEESIHVGDDYSDGIPCTLASTHEPEQVTAVAAVSNETDEISYAELFGSRDPVEDDSGDAHRVQPYFQEPTTVSLTPPVQNDLPTPACSAPIVVTVTDQENHPIYRANVDVHAQGPDDALAFDSGLVRPTQGGHRQEPARNCTQAPPGSAGLQGEHEDPANPDLKHSETTAAGTNTQGTMSFQMYSPSKGDTQITVWSEFDDDDLRCSTEPSANAGIGWLEPGPQPSGIPPDLQTCPDVTPSTTSPEPTDTETTPTDPRGCTLTGTDQGEALNGTPDADVICGLGGNDIIRGLGGNDVIYGDAGDDDLRGGEGSDRIQGGSGKETITGGEGEDILNGLRNNDTVIGGPGSDRVSGNGGIDTVRGGGGADRLDGGPRDDILTGGRGSDALFGRGGDDVLSGGPQRDRCRGGAGTNQLRSCEA